VFATAVGAQEEAEAPDAEPEQAAPDRNKDRPIVVTGLGDWGLATQYPEQAVWLELEDDSRALALFRPEQRVPARSAVIVLADEGQTADQLVVGALRRTLPESGIAALTLGLQSPPRALRQRREARDVPEPAAPEDGELEGAAAEAEAEQVMIDVAADEELEALSEEYRNGVRGLLNAAADELAERGYEQLLVVGVGWSADYVAEWAAGQDALAGAVWLAPKFSPDRLTAVAELLANDRNWWLLDLHNSQGEAADRGKERGAELARADVGRYQRQALPMNDQPGPSDAGRISSRISARVGR